VTDAQCVALIAAQLRTADGITWETAITQASQALKLAKHSWPLYAADYDWTSVTPGRVTVGATSELGGNTLTITTTSGSVPNDLP